MSAASRVDTLQNDRGLKTCFEAANIDAAWSATFCKQHKVETLDDFVYLMDSKDWESGLRDLLQSSADLKDNRIILSRFKAAYENGVTAIKNSQANPKVEENPDLVLPESTLQSVGRDFQKRYGVVLDPYLDPSDALRSRIYKEFRRQTMTVLETRRIKSMMHVAVPKTTENIKLSDSIQLQLQEDESVTISTAIEYYFALRTLCNAWAWAGNFEATEHDGTKKIFLNLSESQAYADFCLRMTVEVGQGSLQWLAKNDMLTRSRMASLIRRNYTGGAALKEALHQTHLEWRSPALQLSGSSQRARGHAPPPEPESAPPAKRPRQIKSDVRRTVSMPLDEVPAVPAGLGPSVQTDEPLTSRQVSVAAEPALQAAPPRHVMMTTDDAARLMFRYSGLCIALLSLGVHFYALAAESDPVARACACQVMPQLLHVDAVEKVQVRDLRAFLQRRRIRGILIGGGSPCQANTVLNSSRKGLGDLRSLQPQYLSRLVDELSREPLCRDVEIVAFLENVQSMPHSVLQQYNRWMHSCPVSVNAATCGWTQRHRFFWLSSRRRGLEANLTPPPSWRWSETPPSQNVPELQYAGPKPIPPRVHSDDGFLPMIDPVQVLRNQGKGAAHTFTREFFHPADRVHQVSPAAAARFEQDSRRFPPGAYEEHSLMWRNQEWRQFTPEERAQLLGIPPACSDWLP
eukprot:s646_g26.t1